MTEESERDVGYPHAFRANEFAAIAAGGVIGALLRHGGELVLPTAGLGFPWATFIENVLGSFLLAFTVAFMAHRVKHPLFNSFTVVGLYGSYTTFSTFTIGFWERLDAGEHMLAWTYAGSTLALGLIVVALGHLLGDRLGGASDAP
jgi:CrcB protein